MGLQPLHWPSSYFYSYKTRHPPISGPFDLCFPLPGLSSSYLHGSFSQFLLQCRLPREAFLTTSRTATPALPQGHGPSPFLRSTSHYVACLLLIFLSWKQFQEGKGLICLVAQYVCDEGTDHIAGITWEGAWLYLSEHCSGGGWDPGCTHSGVRGCRSKLKP